jgi:four helix bundle protein
MDPLFDHERLEVYQLARQFNRDLRDLIDQVPRGHAESIGNLRRAAKSVTRNLAEGCGKWKLPDKINFYQIARASATECAACLDELVDFGLAPETRVRTVKQTLARIIAMLVAMIRSLEEKSRATQDR